MLVLPLTRAWLTSNAAQRVYFCSAILSLALSATVLGVGAAIDTAGGSPTGTVVQAMRLLLMVEIFGAALLWIGMLYFWINFDQPWMGSKSLWFAVLFFATPFGWAVYYFVVYRRLVRRVAQPSSQTISPPIP